MHICISATQKKRSNKAVGICMVLYKYELRSQPSTKTSNLSHHMNNDPCHAILRFTLPFSPSKPNRPKEKKSTDIMLEVTTHVSKPKHMCHPASARTVILCRILTLLPKTKQWDEKKRNRNLSSVCFFGGAATTVRVDGGRVCHGSAIVKHTRAINKRICHMAWKKNHIH